MAYGVTLAPRALKAFEALPRAAQERIRDSIESLRSMPRPAGCAKLRGHHDLYRVRSGNYRIVYRVDDQARHIEIAVVGDRKDVYRIL